MIVGDRYEVGSRIGAGAAGTVYVARDVLIGRRVAIKLVRRPPQEDAEAEEAYERFKVEAQAAGKLSHPNIATIYDFGENDSFSWIVMELVEGESLRHFLGSRIRLSLPQTCRIMNETLAALAYIHDQGIVHRDVKPANILLTPSQQVKIVDFGIARLGDSTRTLMGAVLGTPAYMAPEQLQGGAVDHRADIWSAGVDLYELLTGEKPFSGTPDSIIRSALFTDPPAPSRVSRAAPHAFDAVTGRALAKKVEERFQSATAFADAIATAASIADDDLTLPLATAAGQAVANAPAESSADVLRKTGAVPPRKAEAKARLHGWERGRGAEYWRRTRRNLPVWPSAKLRQAAALAGAGLALLGMVGIAGLALQRGGETAAEHSTGAQDSPMDPTTGTGPQLPTPAPSPRATSMAANGTDPAPIPEAPPTADLPEPSPLDQPTPPSGMPTEPFPAELRRPPSTTPPVSPPGDVLTMPMAASVRAGPDGTAPVVRSVSRGASVHVFARAGRWLQIGDDEPWGWVHDSRVPPENRQR